MKVEKLSEIKKELRALSPENMIEICIKLAKYRKENKELLSYLLYDSENPLFYAENVKSELLEEFYKLKKHGYAAAKELRKILRILERSAKYTRSAEVEVVLLLWFCKNYLIYADLRTAYKPLQTIFLRQTDKIRKLIAKLHEDLQFDYSSEYNDLIEEADGKVRWFDKRSFFL